MPKPPATKFVPRSIDTAALVAALRRRDRSEIMGGVLLCLLGIILLPLGPAFVACLSWGITARMHGGRDFPSWWSHFWICLVTVIPLGFWVARSGASSAIEDAAGSIGEQSWFVRRHTAWGVVLVILMVMGPGLVLMGVRMLRAAARFRQVSRDRAASALGKLLVRSEGIDVFDLLDSNERLENILPSLEYLSQYDWIGASKNGERVWASGEARKRLNLPEP